MPDNEVDRTHEQEKADETVRNLALSLGYEQSQLDALERRIEVGEPLYKILHIEERLLEERYTMAHDFYKNKRFDRAEELFRWLCLMNGTSSANWMGLGACLQGQQRWENARTAYAMAVAWSKSGDLRPLYYVGLCAYQLDDTAAAKKALEEFVIQSSDTSQEYRELVHRACAILLSLEEGV